MCAVYKAPEARELAGREHTEKKTNGCHLRPNDLHVIGNKVCWMEYTAEELSVIICSWTTVTPNVYLLPARLAVTDHVLSQLSLSCVINHMISLISVWIETTFDH